MYKYENGGRVVKYVLLMMSNTLVLNIFFDVALCNAGMLGFLKFCIYLIPLY